MSAKYFKRHTKYGVSLVYWHISRLSVRGLANRLQGSSNSRERRQPFILSAPVVIQPEQPDSRSLCQNYGSIMHRLCTLLNSARWSYANEIPSGDVQGGDVKVPPSPPSRKRGPARPRRKTVLRVVVDQALSPRPSPILNALYRACQSSFPRLKVLSSSSLDAPSLRCRCRILG
jgi:hypothetical protein